MTPRKIQRTQRTIASIYFLSEQLSVVDEYAYKKGISRNKVIEEILKNWIDKKIDTKI